MTIHFCAVWTNSVSQKGGDFSEKPKSRRRRVNTRTRLQQELQQQHLVRTQPDIRAKLYSKVNIEYKHTVYTLQYFVRILEASVDELCFGTDWSSEGEISTA